RVVAAAHRLRDILAGLGLAAWPLLTGGKGIHLVVPVVPRLEWEAAKAFCRAVAELLAREEPDRYTLNLLKRHRKGRIFVDYLRNGYGSTAIAPFSTRARPGAPVATPVLWDEVETGRKP